MDHVAKRVAPYKKIRKVLFVDSIPKSAAGKILRRQLMNHVQFGVVSRLWTFFYSGDVFFFCDLLVWCLGDRHAVHCVQRQNKLTKRLPISQNSVYWQEPRACTVQRNMSDVIHTFYKKKKTWFRLSHLETKKGLTKSKDFSHITFWPIDLIKFQGLLTTVDIEKVLL
jgi:hypothetical protein